MCVLVVSEGVCITSMVVLSIIRESVDSLCRDETDVPIT